MRHDDSRLGIVLPRAIWTALILVGLGILGMGTGCSAPSLVPIVEPGQGMRDDWILGGWQLVETENGPLFGKEAQLRNPFDPEIGSIEFFLVTRHTEPNRYRLWTLMRRDQLDELDEDMEIGVEGWRDAAHALGLLREISLEAASDVSSGYALNFADVDLTTEAGWRLVQLGTPSPLTAFVGVTSMGLLPTPASFRFAATRFDEQNVLELVDLNEQIESLVDPSRVRTFRDGEAPQSREDMLHSSDIRWTTTPTPVARELVRIATKAYEDDSTMRFVQDPRRYTFRER